MSTLFRCPQGHVTEVPQVASAQGPEQALTCPLCGEEIEPVPDDVPTLPPARPGLPETLPPSGMGETSTLPPSPQQASPGTRAGVDGVAGYEILGELGRGGMGVVYKARQTALKRLVALKMVLAGGHAAEQQLVRFRLEAEAVARLKHPGIVQVYEVGETNGLPFFSMEFVEGGSMAGRLEGTPLPAREAAALVQGVARAMQAAHEEGIVHRDLKPHNVLLTKEGQPKITDFGLAKLQGEGGGQTASGAIMGTPSYMAPEQAEGRKDVGPAADVYALGAILYECLTGRPPFKAATPLDTILQVVAEEPVPPRQLQPKLARDLETICLKCLRKEPRSRYPSAAALAEELQRFLEGRPITARPVSIVERGWRWSRRNPVAAVLASLVVLTLLGGIGATSYFAFEENARAREAVHAREDADEQAAAAKVAADNEREARQVSDRRLYVSDLRLVERAWQDNDLGRLRELLAGQLPERTGGIDLRRFEWFYWWRASHFEQATLGGHSEAVRSVVFSPNGQRLASIGGEAKLWDARTGREVPLLPEVSAPGAFNWLQKELGLSGTNEVPFGDAVFSPDSRRLAVPRNRRVVVWNAHDGRHLFSLQGHAEDVYHVAWSPDGKRLATASQDMTARVWDGTTGKQMFVLRGHTDHVHQAVYSPDGSRLATASNDRTVRLWDAETGRLLRTLQGNVEARTLLFSPDGKRLAARSDKIVQVWDVPTGQPQLLTFVGQSDLIESAAFSPDSKRLATASYGSLVRIHDLQTRQTVLTLTGHSGRVRHVSYSPDGLYLATASEDQTVIVWRASTGQRLCVRKGHTGTVNAVAYSPDGKRLASASDDRTIKLWDALAEQEMRSLPLAGPVVAFSPDGRRLVTTGFQGLQVRDAASFVPLLSFKPHSHVVLAAAFSTDSRLLATGSIDQTARVWDAATGRLLHTFTNPTGSVNDVAFSSDGRWLGMACQGGYDEKKGPLGGEVLVWDLSSGQKVLTLRGHQRDVNSVAFHPDGSQLATASTDKTVKLWDAQTGKELANLSGHTGITTSVAFSPDGKVLASGGDRTINLWEVSERRLLFSLKGHNGGVRQVCFSKDGQRLASASDDQTVKVWEVSTGQEITTLRGYTGEVSSVSFHPDGKCLASGGRDSMVTVRIWDGREAETRP